MIVIGLTGYAGAGKDTVGKYLVENHGFHRIAFADAVKEMALVLDPMFNERDYGVEYLHEIVNDGGWEEAKKIPEIRSYLQLLGTEAVRNIIGPESWVSAANRKIQALRDLNPSVRIVITDVRFPNEGFYTCHALSGEVWRIDRPGHESGVSREHESEKYISQLASKVIPNEGDIAQLHHYTDLALADFLANR